MAVPDATESIIAAVGAILTTPLAVRFLPRLVRGLIDAQRTVYEPMASRIAYLEERLESERRASAERERQLEAEMARLQGLLFRAYAVLARHGLTPPDGTPTASPPDRPS